MFTLNMYIGHPISTFSTWFLVAVAKDCLSRISSEEEFKKTIEKIPDYRIKEEKVKSTDTHPCALLIQ